MDVNNGELGGEEAVIDTDMTLGTVPKHIPAEWLYLRSSFHAVYVDFWIGGRSAV